MSPSKYCSDCGTPLEPQARFCPKCGLPVAASGPFPAAPSYGVPAIPPTQKMEEIPDYAPPYVDSPEIPYAPAYDYGSEQPPASNRRYWVACGALAVLACCLLSGGLAAGYALVGDDYNLTISLFTTPTFTPRPPTPVPTRTPPPSPTPLPPTRPPQIVGPTQPPSNPPSGGQPGLTGQQQLSDTSFFDDFSSDALDWPVDDLPEAQYGYSSGGYSMLVKIPDYTRLVRAPVLDLTHLEFDAQVVQGAENGLFGVACFYEDIDNRYEVDIDLDSQSLWFGRYENGTWVDMGDAQSFDHVGQPTHFSVDCTPGMMSAYVNNTLVAEMPVSISGQSREMWLFASTWTDISQGSIQVLFDNVYGYLAQQ
jgi:hypothetical protein